MTPNLKLHCATAILLLALSSAGLAQQSTPQTAGRKTGLVAEAVFLKYRKELERPVKAAPFNVPNERMDVLNEAVKYSAKEDLTFGERSRIVKLLIESYNRKFLTK
jgi:hypothetical protein